MTKTIRKGLIAVLLFVMTVLVGVASWTALGGTARADVNQGHITKMQQYIGAFKDKTIDETLFNPDETTPGNEALWTAYSNAKILYPNLSGEEKAQLTDELKIYDQLDGVFGEAYTYVARVVDTMYQITFKSEVDYIKDKPLVDKLIADLTQLNKDHAKWIPFITKLTNDFEYLKSAKNLMTAVEGYFGEIEAEILKIKVYDTADKSFDVIADEKTATEFIVWDSKETVDAVGTLIKEFVDGKKVEGALADLNITVKLSEDDIKGKIGGKANVAHYSVYSEALKTIAALEAEAKKVVTAIDAVYDKVKASTVYYTWINEIKAARAAYDALDCDPEDTYTGLLAADKATQKLGAYDEGGDTNYNDLQAKIVDVANHTHGDTAVEAHGTIKVKAALEAMETVIGKTSEETASDATGLMKKIEDAEKAVKAVKDASEKKYNQTYKDLIDKARTAVSALDTDIKNWDEDVYYTKNVAKKPEGYEEHTSTYGTEFPEYDDTAYIVDNYDVLKAAEEQWAKWEKQIDDLVKAVTEMVEKYAPAESTHPAINVEYANINDQRDQLTDEQRNAFNNGLDYKGANDENRRLEFSPLGEGKRTPKQVLDYFYSLLNRVYTEIGDLSTKIDSLYSEAEGCVFDKVDEIEALEKQYGDLKGESQPYVQNYWKLLELRAEYNEEKKLVDAWKTAAAALDFEDVTVWNMDRVKTVIDEWNKVLHKKATISDQVNTTDATYDYKEEEIKGAALGLLQTIVKDHEDYSASYAKFDELVKKYNTLVEALQSLAESMIKIECDPALPLDESITWSDALAVVTGNFESFANSYIVDEDVHTTEAEYPGKWWLDNEDSFKYGEDKTSTYKAAYENYLKALEYDARYSVERKINDIYDSEAVVGYETTPETLVKDGKVTLSSKEAIEGARKAYDEYIKGEGTQQGDIRNYGKLEAAEKAYALIVKELDAWRKEVLDLYNATLNEEVTVSVEPEATNYSAELTTAIKAAIAALELGYPVDLDKYTELSTKYEQLTKSGLDGYADAEARIAVLKEAKDLLEKLNTKSTEVIDKFNSDIARLKESYEASNSTLTPEELTEVAEMNELYSKLHETQQELIDDFNSFKDLVDELNATEAFVNMVTELYKDVVENGNVTSLTMYYVDVIEAIYNQFTTEVRTSFEAEFEDKSYEEMIQKIKDKYAEAVDAGTVLSLEKLDELINGNDDGEEGIVKKLESLLGAEGTIKQLQSQLEALKDLITKEETGLQALLSKEITDRATAINELKGNLESAINDLRVELKGYIDGKIAELNDDTLAKLREAQEKAKAAGRTDLYDALTKSEASINAQIEDLESSLESLTEKNDTTAADLNSQIADILKKLADADNVSKNIKTDTQAALNELESKMEKADADLQAQIDKLGSTANALTAVIIVLAVVLVGAVVCIVLLFLKRNKQ